MAERASVSIRAAQAQYSAGASGPGVLDPGGVVSAAQLFKALADPVRVQLVALVRRSPTGEVCFCDLADEFDMPQSTLSHHVRILVDAGILSRERRATWSWYRLRSEPLSALEHLLRPGGPLRRETGGRSGRRCG